MSAADRVWLVSARTEHAAACGLSLTSACAVSMCQSCSLEYTEHIVDGLYEVFGDFPEVEELAGPSRFPSLDALKRVQTAEGDQREVRRRVLSTGRSFDYRR